MPKRIKNRLGQTLIGIIISLGIFTILSAAVITLVFNTYNLVSYTRARTTAIHIASEKIEIIRNLPFVDVGTINGIPPGMLPQEENILRNHQNYLAKTSVVYVDDPFDSLAPADLLPIDYKRIRVDVSWGGVAPSKSNTITLITDISPPSIETITNAGTISILVFDANANPVPGANINLLASTLNPPVNLNLETNSEGRVILPGAPVCVSCYQITVTKSGYSSERTYSTTEIANPNKPHLTIIDQSVSEITFSIDQLSNLTISSLNTKENNFSPLSNQTLHLQGEKTLGTTSLDEPVYKYSQDITTNSTGIYELENVEWDNYHITLPTSSTETFAGKNPLPPIQLLPNSDQSTSVSLANKTASSLLAIFLDESSSPISSVTATLNQSGSPIATLSSGVELDPDFGQTFFSDLTAGLYSLVATASGYLDSTIDLNLTGNTEEIIYLGSQ
ncbi:hypothetical protein A2382_00330 [Candidatus Woesebacteria bacterium RIFOXYB1_FULL_38_16]|uniref:Carboxypeptidase regulatory-like domain-containing protein n=1 Tax=Candidatus Woesebacteria bacterium RIFOXYB1_FULL_38_16 TaxID=1802538 RepID=A0A1F8CSA5_9BACT|nr:MAG: hypothetical protein A2191_01145 [Candidatus Woesebacteria bacterium RIFOXYA1_FULL_38_9]OGM79217.1 MAG: hypothetical protein A2382_00330 [Candidatus Woesebacteria bacterium RIFOXYB1_FULL_38_16]